MTGVQTCALPISIMIRLRLPNITATNTGGQIVQIIKYLRQLVTDINAVLDEIEMNQTGGMNNGG